MWTPSSACLIEMFGEHEYLSALGATDGCIVPIFIQDLLLNRLRRTRYLGQYLWHFCDDARLPICEPTRTPSASLPPRPVKDIKPNRIGHDYAGCPFQHQNRVSLIEFC